MLGRFGSALLAASALATAVAAPVAAVTLAPVRVPLPATPPVVAPSSADRGAFLAPAPAVSGPAAAGLPWLHVAHPGGAARPYIADESGRLVLLRGANAAGLVDYWTGAPSNPPLFPVDPAAYTGSCPQNFTSIEAPPLCEVDATAAAVPSDTSEDDFAQMRARGFDVVRLALSWSLLEPQPGRYSTLYVDRIAQVVAWAEQQGVRVLLDMHQDAWGRSIAGNGTAVPPLLQSPRGFDGAPAWATLTDGLPAVAVDGVRELDPAVQQAFTSFWLNRDVPGPPGAAGGSGLQDHYIGAIAALAARFRDDGGVLGYEVMNEPSPGFLPFGAFDDGWLFPFYRRVIDAITGTRDGLVCPAGTTYTAACGYADLGIHDRRHLVLVEPMIVRDLVDASTEVPLPFTSYRNTVLAPHVYTHALTVDRSLGFTAENSPFPVSYDQGLQTADLEARAMDTALMDTEYGDNPSDDPVVLAQQAQAQERAQVSSTVWIWKENCNDVSPAFSWGVYDGVSSAACRMHGAQPVPQNGPLRPERVALLSRVWPRAVEGVLHSESYDPTTQGFTMSATSSRHVHVGDTAHETLVYIPSGVGGAARVGGAGVLDTVVLNPDGSRLAEVAPSGGAYTVDITAAPSAAPAYSMRGRTLRSF
jgi:endoglycosylceramidase